MTQGADALRLATYMVVCAIASPMPERTRQLSDDLLEENRRLSAEVRALRARIAELESALSFHAQLLQLWNRTQREHEIRLARELDRMARGPVGHG